MDTSATEKAGFGLIHFDGNSESDFRCLRLRGVESDQEIGEQLPAQPINDREQD